MKRSTLFSFRRNDAGIQRGWTGVRWHGSLVSAGLTGWGRAPSRVYESWWPNLSDLTKMMDALGLLDWGLAPFARRALCGRGANRGQAASSGSSHGGPGKVISPAPWLISAGEIPIFCWLQFSETPPTRARPHACPSPRGQRFRSYGRPGTVAMGGHGDVAWRPCTAAGCRATGRS